MAYPDPYPRPAPDAFIRRWLFITACIATLMLLWQFLPAIEAWFTPREAAERTVTARGDLAADEKATIELFEKSRASVVYITTAQLVRDVWTRNVFSVPRGTGSGFIWDDAGHVVTNFHVIQGASEATVKLADGRDYQAALVGTSPAHDIAVLKIGVGFKRPACRAARHQRRPQGGTEGLCYRQPLRPGLDANHRHRLRARPLVTGRSGRPGH
jgi:S1-C subfamily serine protease